MNQLTLLQNGFKKIPRVLRLTMLITRTIQRGQSHIERGIFILQTRCRKGEEINLSTTGFDGRKKTITSKLNKS